MSQNTFGEMDVNAVKEDMAKLDSEFLSVPSPGQITVRACPPCEGKKIPYHKWTLHYNLRVEGYDGIHVCGKHFNESCPICGAVSKLYDRSMAQRDYFAQAAYDIRAGSRFYWNMIPNVQQQEVLDPRSNQKVVISESMNPDAKILPYPASETTQKLLTRQMTDYGNFVSPYQGNDIRLVREPSGNQDPKYAATQVYILPKKTCVSQRLIDLMNASMPKLEELFQRTDTAILQQIAELYIAKKLEGAGIRANSSVAMPNNPVGPQGYIQQTTPVLPAGMPPAPPVPPQAPMTLPHQIPSQAPANTVPMGVLDSMLDDLQKAAPPSSVVPAAPQQTVQAPAANTVPLIPANAPFKLG